MTYYFPFGVTNPVATSASFTELATTSSFTASVLSTITTASYAGSILTSSPQGPSGSAATLGICTDPAPQGPSGSIGPSGSQGPNLTSCPKGTVLCTNLTAPSGYQLVCIQTPVGCSGTVICPDTLP
jgi:hypothetical protein